MGRTEPLRIHAPDLVGAKTTVLVGLVEKEDFGLPFREFLEVEPAFLIPSATSKSVCAQAAVPNMQAAAVTSAKLNNGWESPSCWSWLLRLSTEDPPLTVRLTTGRAERLLSLTGDDDLLLELAAIAAIGRLVLPGQENIPRWSSRVWTEIASLRARFSWKGKYPDLPVRGRLRR